MSQPATEASAQVLQSPQSNSSVTCTTTINTGKTIPAMDAMSRSCITWNRFRTTLRITAHRFKGFSSVFSQMFSDLDTLRSKPSDKTVRNQFISSAQSLCTYFNQMSDNLSKLQDDCNEEIRNNVDKINSISEKISLLNKEINQIETGTGVEAGSLRDERRISSTACPRLLMYLIMRQRCKTPMETTWAAQISRSI